MNTADHTVKIKNQQPPLLIHLFIKIKMIYVVKSNEDTQHCSRHVLAIKYTCKHIINKVPLWDGTVKTNQ